MIKTRILCFLLLVSLVVTFAGCGVRENTSDSGDTTEQKSDFYITDENCFPIETRYGILEFPEKWKEMIKYEISEGDVYTVKFHGKTSVGDVPLFDLTFNGGDGYYLGQMSVDGQTVKLYIDDYPIDKTKLSEEEYFNCRSMKEGVNVIISRLVEKNGFVLPDNN